MSLTPLILPVRGGGGEAATTAINSMPNTFFEPLNVVGGLNVGLATQANLLMGMTTPGGGPVNGGGLAGGRMMEPNPFENTFNQAGLEAPSTVGAGAAATQMSGFDHLMTAVKLESPAITNSMHLLTAASEFELMQKQQQHQQIQQQLQPAMPVQPVPKSKRAAAAATAAAAAEMNNPSLYASPVAAGGRKASPAKAATPSSAGKKATPVRKAAVKKVETFSDDDDMDDDDGEGDDDGDNGTGPLSSKRERFLARNRIAAQKCRRKRKEHLDELNAVTAELQRTNENLIKEIEFLKNSNYYVRTLLYEHKDCHVVRKSGLTQLLDSITAPSLSNAISAAQLAPVVARTSSYT